ncbi:MAG: uracil-DNA glycosylase family protein [Prochloraceae cyanobacterium]
MSKLEDLIASIQTEAEREAFPIDIPVYEAAGLKPTLPILYAGNLESKVCFFARDLGKDEVRARQPLIGAAGTLVRQGVYLALYKQQPTGKEDLQKVCDRILLTNTVPYKPPGNKAYLAGVKKRFRPYLERLLVLHWQGDRIITLGTEAFKWFSPYAAKGMVNDFFKTSDRFIKELPVTLTAKDDLGMSHQRQVKLLPLPHPSPLNQKYYARFPEMLQKRLENLF